MKKRSITILGGGNTAFASAAKLALDGHSVTICELPEFADSIDAVTVDKRIALDFEGTTQTASLQDVTTDISNALEGANLVLVMVPAYAHRAFAMACAPHLNADHIVVLMPGTLGSLEWARILNESGGQGVTLAEVDTSPYVCRKTSPDSATILGVVTGLGVGVFPTTETERVTQEMESLFPGTTSYTDVVECGLSSLNPVVHPAGVLMNAGRIEHSRGDFYFYDEGVTPSVAKVIMSVDSERRAIGQRLGYNLPPVNEAFHAAGFGPDGDLWETINGSRMLTQLKAPGSMENRWLTEDTPYGIATWSLLGKAMGVETPVMDSVIKICGVVTGFDPWTRGRNLTDLGVAGMDAVQLKRYLRIGHV